MVPDRFRTSPPRTPARSRRAASAALVTFGALVLAVLLGACSSSAKSAGARTSTTPPTSGLQTPVAAPAIEMSRATSAGCNPPSSPGSGHPDPLVARVFNVTDSTGAPYLLGWQIVPYRGPSRSYTFGTGGNLLALQPATGGRPLGYGTGTVTFTESADAGTIKATITLKGNHTVSVSGSWHCVSSGGTSTTKPTGGPTN
jgi:hypothetical protein